MTDNWDEKPGTFEFIEHDVPVYYAEAMDAWLEKVKTEHDAEIISLENHITELLEKAEKWDDIMERSMEAPYIDCVSNLKKLQAIKTYSEREFKAGYLIKPIDILKILEGEE